MRPTPDPPRDLVDGMLRRLLSRRENLADFLRQAQPQIAGNFDFALTRELSREFVTDDWRYREGDLVFEIPYRRGQDTTRLMVCLLLEHQSDTDAVMPLRMLYQAVMYWDGLWRTWTEQPRPRPPLRLRPVLPVVLYTGERPWGSNETLQDLCDGPPELLAFLPIWRPQFWSLAAHTPEELLAGGPLLQLLAVMRAIREDTPRFLAFYREASTHVAALSDAEQVRWQELVQALLSYGVWRRPVADRESCIEAVRQTNPRRNTEVTNMAKTIAEAWMDEGALRGARRMLRKYIEMRFGSIPEELAARMDRIEDLDRLEAALLQVHQVEKLEDLQL
jgi:hypothetical protein